MKNKTGLLIIAMASLSMQNMAYAVTETVTGENGVSGASGVVPSSDGQDGTNGGQGVAQAVSSTLNTDTFNQATARGGLAGHGGNGADGISEPGLWDGGHGGDGGVGGGASATSNTTGSTTTPDIRAGASATGGTGGNAGRGGFRADLSADRGTDGNAGAGGSASATATASHAGTGTVNVFAGSLGGEGGNLTPSNRLAPANSVTRGSAFAGDGGGATVSVYGESLTGRDVTAKGNATGGDGGNVASNTGDRLTGISAGNGANVSLVNAVDGSTTGALSLTQDATGGKAGGVGSLTGFGNLGNAGAALSSLTKITISRSLTVNTNANGGEGANFVMTDVPDTFSGQAVGGTGGAATAHSSATNLGGHATASAVAIGGNGGTGYNRVSGLGFTDGVGGDGGEAAATAYAESVGGVASATARQTGGNGAFNVPATAGNGADSIMVDAVSGSSDVDLILLQSATGGSGLTTATGGSGGNARSTLTAINAGGGHIQGTIEARAGSGTIGGSSHAAADLTANGNVTLNVDSIVGVGYSTRGEATLGPVIGRSLEGGVVRVSARAVDYDASLTDIVDGFTTGSLLLNQNAQGVHAGSLEAPGTLTGNAFSSLTKVTNETTALSIGVSASGGNGFTLLPGGTADAVSSGTNTGGSSSFATSRSTGGHGGSATASTGSAGSAAGSGADASSTSNASIIDGTYTGRFSSATIATSEALGGNAGSVSGGLNLTTEGGNGGAADSISTASGTNSIVSSLRSTSKASGGKGSNIISSLAQGGDGGNAFAQATTILNGGRTRDFPIRAEATAIGGAAGTNTGGGLGGRGGDAIAISEVIGVNFTFSTASVTTGTGGQGNTAGNVSATALISGGSGTAKAEIISPPTSSVSGLNYGFVTQGSVTSIAGSNSLQAGRRIEASLSVGNSPAPAVSSAISAAPSALSTVSTNALSTSAVGLQSVTRVDVLPDAAAVSQALNGNSGVAENFDLNGGSDMLALMTIGSMQDGSIFSNSFSNEINLSMDMTQLSTQQELLFGFMNPVITGNGFDSMTFQVLQEGNVVLNQSFNNVSVANAFFSDQTINFGDWTQGLVGDLDLSFMFDFSISGVGDGFYFDMAYGNSTIGSGIVPVPAAVWLFGSGLIGLVVVARRKVE